MTWDCQLGSRAERALARLPERDRQRINRALNQMTDEPLSGDVVPLRGPYQGTFRRRVGAGRILFAAMPEARIVIIHDIVRRTSVTY